MTCKTSSKSKNMKLELKIRILAAKNVHFTQSLPICSYEERMGAQRGTKVRNTMMQALQLLLR